MTALSDLRAQWKKHRVAVELTALSAFACVVFGGVGIAARSRLTAIRTEQQRTASAVQQVVSFQSAFRPGAAGESARMSLPESLQVAVPRDLRVGLAEHVATMAETAGLKNVRVWFVQGADTAAPPPEPDLLDAPVAIANYTLAVECEGSYDAVLTLMRELPPSLAFQRLVASGTAPEKPRFHLTLAVFEADTAATTDNAARHG